MKLGISPLIVLTAQAVLTPCVHGQTTTVKFDQVSIEDSPVARSGCSFFGIDGSPGTSTFDITKSCTNKQVDATVTLTFPAGDLTGTVVSGSFNLTSPSTAPFSITVSRKLPASVFVWGANITDACKSLIQVPSLTCQIGTLQFVKAENRAYLDEFLKTQGDDTADEFFIRIWFNVSTPVDFDTSDLTPDDSGGACARPTSLKSPPTASAVTATNHLTGLAGDSKLATGTFTMKCIPGAPGGACSTDYKITTLFPNQDWFKITSLLEGVLTGTAPIKITADPSMLTPAGSPYSAKFTIEGHCTSCPKTVTVLFDVLPPCAPKLQISSVFPRRGAVIWAAEVKSPPFLASIDYAAPYDTQVALELVDANGNLLNAGDSTAAVTAGTGTVQLAMSPSSALHTTDPATGQPIVTFVNLRAVFSTLGQDGTPLKNLVDPPFRSDPILYNLAPAPQLSMTAGCLDGESFVSAGVPAGTVPVLKDLACWPAVQVTSSFLGPQQAQLTIDRAQYFRDEPRGDDLMPPKTVHPAGPSQVFTLTSQDSRASAHGFVRNYTELSAADRVLVRLLLHNPDTQQVIVSDPKTIGFNRVHIVNCLPAVARVLKLKDAAIACDPEYSVWDQPSLLERGSSAEPDYHHLTVNPIRELAPFASGKFEDDPILLPDTTLLASQPIILYLLAQGTPGGYQFVSYDYMTYWRVAQSLDDVINVVGRDKVFTFLAGNLKFINGLGLTGTLGNLVKLATEVCGSSANQRACVSALQAAYDLDRRLNKSSADRQAAAPAGVLGIASTWAFDNPIAKGTGFQAELTLNYSANQLPDRPDFVESQLQIVSYDPDAGVAEILPTTLDTTAKTATAHLDHLAPFYSLAMVAPLSKTLLRSPLLLAGGDLSSGLALENLGSSVANVTLAAFAGDGTPLAGAANTASLRIAASAQQGGLASDLFSLGTQRISESLQLTVDQPGVAGAQVLGGAGLLDILPLESAASNTWVLSLVEQNDLYGTQVHVANNANYGANVQFDLRGPDGASLATYSTDLEAKGKVALGLRSIFPGLTSPFSGYLLVTAGQDITAAALLMSRTALAAIGGKVPAPASGAGKLYGPIMGGSSYAVRVNLVNLDASGATLAIHAYRPDGTEAAPAANVTLGAKQQYTKDLTQVFGRDPGAVSLVVETSSLAVLGDVVLSDATPADRYRASIALTATPQSSLVIPYVVADGTAVTSLALSNAGTTVANAKLTLYAPDGSQAGSTTAKLALNASLAGTLAALFPAAAAGAYVTVTSDQPLTAMALIDPGVRDVAAVPGLPMPGTDGGAIGPGPTPAPVISVAASLDFGNVTLGQSKDLTLTVGNSGNASLTVSALTANGGAFRVTGPQTPFTLPAGGSQAVTVRFTPAASGTASGSLVISSNDPARASATVSLTGIGLAGAPVMSVSPPSLAFGAVTVGQPKDLTLTIANKGTAPLVVRSIASNNPQFAAIDGPPTLAAGVSASVTVRFTPTTATPQTGNLTIAGNDPSTPAITVSLTGTGVAVLGAQAIDVAPLLLDYGTVNVGQNKDLNAFLTNKGAATLVVSSIVSDNPQFVPIFSSITLPPGANTNLPVRFIPSSAGAQSGNLILASNDPQTPIVKLPVKGTGVAVAGDVTLKVDGGTFTGSVGYPQGADPAVFVNRLTPPSYPATLRNVQIFFGNRTNGLKAGAPITVVAATNPSGSASFSALSVGVLNLVPATVGATGNFSTYAVPETTIASGDFVVGFLVSPNPAGVFPGDLDQVTSSRKQSYLSGDGFTFALVDSFGASTAGNLGIRATVTLGGGK